MKNALRTICENSLTGLRTSGALLIGNSILLYHGVLGNAAPAGRIGLIGFFLLVFASIPWTQLKKD